MVEKSTVVTKIVCDTIDTERIIDEIKGWYYSNAIGMENIEVIVEK